MNQVLHPMKKALILLILFIAHFSIGQLNPQFQTKAFNHLFEVNKEWQHHKDVSPGNQVTFKNDIERIHLHLSLVTRHLKSQNSDHFTSVQLKRRASLLDSLQEYADNRTFPVNKYHNSRTPYFIDESGVHCAVGYLIQKSGQEELAQRIRREHNYDYIRDIKTPGVAEWASSHGFLLEELAWIQPTYQAPFAFTTVQDGTNGELIAMSKDTTSSRVYFIGSFDSVDVSLCSNVGYYENDSLFCLSNGIDGDLTDIVVKDGIVYVTGEIEFQGQSYSYATFENNIWNYHNVPGQEGRMGVTIFFAEDGSMEIPLSMGQGQTSTLWRRNTNGIWEEVLTVSGWIRTIAEGNDKRVYGGRMYWYSLASDPTNLQFANHSLVHNTLDDTYHSPEGDLPVEIFKVKFLFGRFFYGAQAPVGVYPIKSLLTLQADSLLAITSYGLQGVWGGSWITITDFEQSGPNSISIVGDFWAGGMTQGYGFGTINCSQLESAVANGSSNMVQISSLGSLPSPSRCIVIHESNCLIGGNIPSYRNIVKYDNPLETQELEIAQLNVYPNPVTDKITVEAQVEGLEVYSTSGQLLQKSNSNSIQIEHLVPGTYVLNILLQNGDKQSKQIVKL